MLEINNIRYQYDHDWFHFSLNVERGDIISLIGPSGAGKSTLLSLLAGFISPDSGCICVDGKQIDLLPSYERPFAMLFQEYNLFPHLSVRQNIGLGVDPGLSLSSKQWDLVDEAANQVGIGELIEKKPEQLSGGQKQRAALARCFVQNRPFWLLDEPFSALDPIVRQDMLELVKTLAKQQQVTVIMVTHHLNDARKIANRFAFIADYSVVETGDIELLQNAHSNPLLSAFIRAGE
ncbi:thiamine ABC transporter ATP-binding protein [Vibrio viridaestus]|uniref:Thiamine ABC transporter ATP-binding protein n=1 Tax=Vibrio viridaestus TaxID=2487322 RepID=A0A3N9TBX4_9VIBR|nr:thiamine ABC transporter ATP-binding protein [Vibrio viridaestus]RQW61569.1 thiamine ABC transporter ATP-binding protein [Vibrio viridaestus]